MVESSVPVTKWRAEQEHLATIKAKVYCFDVQSCPSCNSPIPERGSFCPTCAVQTRCKSCRELLEPNATACVECGTLTTKGGGDNQVGSQPAMDLGAVGSIMNTLHYDDRKQGRSLRVSLTNEAADSFSGAIGMFIVGHAVQKTAPSVKKTVLNNQPALPGLDTSEAIDIDEAPQGDPVASIPPMSLEKQRLHSVFRYKGDSLELEEPRLKAGSKLDYARRLTFLFLYGHELEGRDEVLKASLVSILDKEKVFDTNTANWIRTSTALKIEDDKVRLNKEGREKATATLNEVLDSAVENKWTPELVSGRAQNSSQTGSAQKPAAGKRPTINVKEITNKWKTQFGSMTEVHGKLNSSETYIKGLFALWAMEKIGRDSCKIVSSHVLAKFLLDAVVIQVDDRNLGRALEKPKAKGKAIKVAGGYQIQPAGSTQIEQLLGLDKPKGKAR